MSEGTPGPRTDTPGSRPEATDAPGSRPEATRDPSSLSPPARRLFEALLAERAGSADGPDAPPAHPERYEISPSQRRLWKLESLAAGTAWGNVPAAFRVRGPLAPDTLDAALRDVVARQDVLRVRYRETEGGVEAVVRPAPDAVLETAPASPGYEEALRAARQAAARPLDPAEGPPFRARWFPAGAEDGVLLLLTHHLATDGWSMGLLLREISAAYEARREDRAPELGGLRRSYGGVVLADRARSAGEVEPEAVAYWRERLAGAPRETPLPGRAAGAGAEAFRAARVRGGISGPVAAHIRGLAASGGVTPFGAVLALFQILLARRCGASDIVLGTTVSDRGHPDRERLVGNFGNNVLLRTRLEQDASVRDVLASVRETLPRDLAHQALALERLVGDPDVGVRIPRMNVLFMFREGSPEDHLALAGCEVAFEPMDVGVSTLDLVLDVQDRGELGFPFVVEYRLARVSGPEAEALVRDLEALADAVAADPDLACRALPIAHGRWRAPGSSAEEEKAADAVAGPDPDRSAEADDMTAAERRLAAMWQEALDVPSVGPHDNFFELGGHSLLAISVLERIEEETGTRLTPVDLVSQTLAQIAAAAEAGDGEGGRDAGDEGRSSGGLLRRWLGRGAG